MSVFTPKSINVGFTYEADTLLVGSIGGRSYKVQRLIVTIEPDEEADDGIYVDVRTWGYRLTQAGTADKRVGFDRVYLSSQDTAPWVEDAKNRYAKLVVLAS